MLPRPPPSTPFPYTTLFRSGAWTKIVAEALARCGCADETLAAAIAREYAARRRDTMRLFPETRAFLDALRTRGLPLALDRKSTRLNSSHRCISYAVFCLKKK